MKILGFKIKTTLFVMILWIAGHCYGPTTGSVEFKFAIGTGIVRGELVSKENELSKHFILVTTDSTKEPIDTNEVSLKHTIFGPETQLSFYLNEFISVGLNYQNDGFEQQIKNNGANLYEGDLLNIHRIAGNFSLFTPFILKKLKFAGGINLGYDFGTINRIAAIADNFELRSQIRNEIMAYNESSKFNGFHFGFRTNLIYYVANPFYIGLLGKYNFDNLNLSGDNKDLYKGNFKNFSYLISFTLGVHTRWQK
jgi:hypothetical protein